MPRRTRAALITTTCLLSTLLLPAGRAAAAPAPGCTGTLWTSGTDGYHTYRIPAVVNVRGTLVAFAEARRDSAADNGDIEVVQRRSTDGGCTWSPQRVVADEGHDTIGNPTPLVTASGTLVLLTNRQKGAVTIGQIEAGTVTVADGRRVYVQTSQDAGGSWSARREITSSVKKAAWRWYATGPGHGLTLTQGPDRGRLVAAAYHSEPGKQGVDLLLSDDDGRSWRLGASETRNNKVINPGESSAAQLPDGRIYVSARNSGGSSGVNRAAAYSETAGRTFTGPFRPLPAITTPPVQGTVLQDPGYPAGVTCAPLLYAGPQDPTARRHLTLRRSDDGGGSWRTVTDLTPATGPAAYSDMTKISRTKVGVAYETGTSNPYQRIAWRSVTLNCP
ncbi:glycoside hydrolase [Streptomyces sp. NBC_01476]|uniref:sialidase family protein n=1 Tax=Streptomyces sp. NBC_01476 TaxID=2903881 RepID=UPI002E36D544|nr:sialidase family protein [Streptomyces sp. NBC_01476]